MVLSSSSSTAIKFALRSRFRSKSAYGTQSTHTVAPPTSSPPLANAPSSKKDINAETRLAVTTHTKGEIGVCFKNCLAPEVKTEIAWNVTRMIDLDIDVGADTVDYHVIPNQESLPGLETEMHKPEGLVKEIMDEKRASRSEESP